MSKFILLVVLMAGLTASLSACAAPRPPPNNYQAEYYEQLLSGRILVIEHKRPAAKKDAGIVRAVYYGLDGNMAACWRFKGKHPHHDGRWRVTTGDADTATAALPLLNSWPIGERPDPRKEKGHRPIYYNITTGEVYTLYKKRKNRGYGYWWKGWVQASWPRAMKDACPDLTLPDDLPINEKQTSLDTKEMRAQDPDAPIIGYTSDPAEHSFLKFWIAGYGKIFRMPDGRRVAMNHHRDGDQLWELDDDNAVVDIGEITVVPDQPALMAEWQKSERVDILRPGEPLPLEDTGEQHPAFALMDWIITRDQDIGLPFSGRKNLAFHFEDYGIVIARTIDGDVEGDWRLDGGQLWVAFKEHDETNIYPTELLGPYLGWYPESGKAPQAAKADAAQ